MPILRDRLWNALLQKYVQSSCAGKNAPNGNEGHDRINEAWSDVKSERTERTPALSIATEGLLRAKIEVQIRVGIGLRVIPRIGAP